MLIVSWNHAGGALLALASGLALVGCGKVVVDGIASSGFGGSGGRAAEGSGGSAAEGSGGAITSVCTPQDWALRGSIDGVPIDLTVPYSYSGAFLQDMLNDPGFVTSADDHGGQLMFLYTKCSLEGDGLTCPTDVGMFRVPLVPPVPGEPFVANQMLWICDATGPTVTFKPQESKPEAEWVGGPVQFASLRRLGTCPGVPVSGQLTRCDNAISCTKDGIFGMVDGHAVDAPFVSGVYRDGYTLETGFEGRSLLFSGPGPDPSVFVMPDGSGDPGAIYCIGSNGSDPVTGNQVMGSLSRLGTCAEAEPIAGSVTACIGF